MVRTWELTGDDGSLLRGSINLAQVGDVAAVGRHVEVIPKSVASDIDSIEFDPTPTQVLERDPVAAFDLTGLAPKESLTITYEVAVPPDGVSQRRLERYVDEQIEAEEVYFREHPPPGLVTLASLAVDKPDLELDMGATNQLLITGTMSDGSPAYQEVLVGLVWTTSAPRVAEVTGGLVTAIGPGSAEIKAQVGDLTATTTVRVNDARETAARPSTTTTAAPITTATTSPAPRPASPVSSTTTTTQPSTTSTQHATTTTTVDDPRQVTLTRGRAAAGQPGCESSPGCSYFVIAWSSFSAGSHTYSCHTANGQAFYSRTSPPLPSGSSGANYELQCWADPGGYGGVFVRLDGVQSNVAMW